MPPPRFPPSPAFRRWRWRVRYGLCLPHSGVPAPYPAYTSRTADSLGTMPDGLFANAGQPA